MSTTKPKEEPYRTLQSDIDMSKLDTFNQWRKYIYCWLDKGDLSFEDMVNRAYGTLEFDPRDMRWAEFTASEMKFTPVSGTEEFPEYYSTYLGRSVRHRVFEEIDLNGDLKKLGEVIDALQEKDPRKYIEKVRELGIQVNVLDTLEYSFDPNGRLP